MGHKMINLLRKSFCMNMERRFYHGIPFFDLYENTTGESISEPFMTTLKKKHPKIELLNHQRLLSTLQILEKFGITAYEACKDPHIFCMNPITMDNYGEILKECGFVTLLPKHIIRYHTLVRSRTISQLKKQGLIDSSYHLEEKIIQKITEWQESKYDPYNFDEESASILKVRTYILEKYLKWKLKMTSEHFERHCKSNLPLRHKPMTDIQEAIELAQNIIKLDTQKIRNNSFIISSDPVKTRLILENVDSLAGINIHEVIKAEPAILKSNYNYILEIREMLKEFEIPEEAQRRCFRVYCMNPETVRERLQELRDTKEYKIFATNPRVLLMVVHKNKMLERIGKLESANKQCFSLNHLVSSNKVFDNYINSFGSKVCGRDLATLICASLQITRLPGRPAGGAPSPREALHAALRQLRRHRFWLHAALDVVAANIRYLRRSVDDDVIFHNCQLLLYPQSEIEQYLEYLLDMRKYGRSKYSNLELSHYNNLDFSGISDYQVLALVHYEIERKHHFSGDGIWGKQDRARTEADSVGL